MRFEIPWVDRPPHEIVRERVRLTVRPFDVPEDTQIVSRLIEHLGSDAMLLWASDWPHAHFEGDATVPPGLPEELLHRIMVENPLATYARLREGGSA